MRLGMLLDVAVWRANARIVDDVCVIGNLTLCDGSWVLSQWYMVSGTGAVCNRTR